MTNEQTEETTWWRSVVSKYETPSLSSSTWQILNSVVPYLALWYLMSITIHLSYLLTIAVGAVSAGFWIRVFIISHDCGHGSFFKSRRANHFWGAVTGIMTCTPYLYWRREHAMHHGSSGNLDRRGIGDIWTLTVDEYLASSRWKRIWYRIYRHPLVMFGIGALLVFTLYYRFTDGVQSPQERRSVYWTNTVLALIVAGMIAWLGLKHYLMIIIPVMLMACSAGVWMFYVQHQFEGVYWDRDDDWDYLKQAMEGSSFYKLPRVLQWFTGNIGFHHIHHLSHRIPNYLLEKCHRENEMFQDVKHITLLTSLKSLSFRLWDEEKRQLVSFRALRELRSAA